MIRTAALLVVAAMAADAGAGTRVDPGTLARGINMDHIFDAYRDPGDPWTDQDMKAIGKAINPEEFRLAARLGFTHIRLNIGQIFLQDQKVPFGFREEGFRLLDRAVDAIGTAGLAVILDLHQIPPPDVARDPRERRKLNALWKRLARQYASSTTFIAFELLNEPRIMDVEKWRMLTAELIDTIRRVDRNRTIIVTGSNWGGPEEIMKLGNMGIGNILYSFHFYEPFVFTHQGAGWGEPGVGALRGIRYPIDPAQMAAELAKTKGTEEETWPFMDWHEGGGAAELEHRLQPLFDWAKAGKLNLYCGEFGVHKPVAPPADRARWIADMVGILKKHDIGWAMWCWHSGFDLVDDRGIPDPAVIEALGLR